MRAPGIRVSRLATLTDLSPQVARAWVGYLAERGVVRVGQGEDPRVGARAAGSHWRAWRASLVHAAAQQAAATST